MSDNKAREQGQWGEEAARRLPPSRQALLLGRVERPIAPGDAFDLFSVSDCTAKLDFRFSVAGVQHLFHALQIPPVVVLSDGYRFDGLEALCIMLRRLAYPARPHDLKPLFPGRTSDLLGRVFIHMIDLVFDKFEDTIYFAEGLVRRRIAAYCAAVHASGAPLDSVFGFIDRTNVEICEPLAIPEEERRKYQTNPRYTGAETDYYVGFQAVTAPDGMCVHFWGPFPGNRHHMGLLHASDLLEFIGSDRTDLFRDRYIYGSSRYGLHRSVMTDFHPQTRAVADQKAFSTRMNRQRACTKWTFGRMKSIWAFLNDKQQLEIGQVPVGKIVQVAMLLTNCDNCLNGGNQTSQHFGLRPPTLAEYLGLN